MDGVLTPDEIAKKRKHLNLNQKDAGRLFGGGINRLTDMNEEQTQSSNP